MLRIATYNRLSSKTQAKYDALARHQFHLREAVVSVGGDPSTTINLEDIETGASETRAGLVELIRLIENNEIDLVICLRTDRLTRDIGMGDRIVKVVEKSKVKLYEIYRGGFLDFSNSSDWQYFAGACVKAEGENRELKARQKRSYKYQRFMGNPNYQPPYCYKRIRDGEKVWYEIDPELEPVAVRSLEIFLETMRIKESVRLIYQETNKKWSVTGFVRWLKNPVLRGHTPYLRMSLDGLKKVYEPQEIKYNTHPDQILITPSIDAKLSAIFDGNAMIYSDIAKARCEKREHHPLVGLMRCDKCSSNMSIITTGRQKNQYVYCSSRREKLPGTICGDAAINDTRTYHEKRGKSSIRLTEVESFVDLKLTLKACEIAERVLNANETIPWTEKDLKVMENIRQLEEMIKTNGDAKGYKQLEISELRLQLETKKRFDLDPDIKKLLIESGQNQEFWKLLTLEQKRLYLKKLVQRVRISDSVCVEVDFLI